MLHTCIHLCLLPCSATQDSLARCADSHYIAGELSTAQQQKALYAFCALAAMQEHCVEAKITACATPLPLYGKQSAACLLVVIEVGNMSPICEVSQVPHPQHPLLVTTC